jgi:hypothetical protein
MACTVGRHVVITQAHILGISAKRLPIVRIGFNIAGLALIVFLLRAGALLVPGTNWDPSRYGQSLSVVNQVVSWSLALVCVIAVMACFGTFRHYVRRERV